MSSRALSKPPSNPVLLAPIEPMLASVGELPTRGEWSYQLKGDGIRLLCYVAADGVLLRTRNQHDVTDRYPEFQALTAKKVRTRGSHKRKAAKRAGTHAAVRTRGK